MSRTAPSRASHRRDASVTLVERAAAGVVQIAGDGESILSDRGVVSAIGIGGTIPEEFLDAFNTALGQHRAWERPTATIPA